MKESTIFSLILFLLTTFAEANTSLSYAHKKNSDYIIKGHDEYEFEACHSFNKEEDKDYYLTCSGEGIKEEKALRKLANDTKAIAAIELKASFLELLKENTLEKLQEQKKQIESVLKCLNTKNKDPLCKKIKEEIVNSTTHGLRQMRQLMALSEGSSPYAQEDLIYTKNIRHHVGNDRSPSLSKNEIEDLNNYDKIFNDAYREKWLRENSEKNKCIVKNSDNQFELKKGNGAYSCESYFSNIIKKSKSKEIKKIHDDAKKEYLNLATKMPILTTLNLRGDENPSLILNEVTKKTQKIYDQINEAIKETKKIDNKKLYQLVANKNIMESFLRSHGPSQVLCDIAQDYKDDTFYNELKVDLLLAGSAIVGGGVCALTAGFGCIVGVGIVGEGAAIYLSNKRLQTDRNKFLTGLNDANQVVDRQDDFTLSLVMAPLAVGGEFLGKAITTGKKIARAEAKVAPKLTFELKSKADLLHQYGKYELTNPSQNKAWINVAKKDEASLFFDIENSALKRLNDTLSDKDLVTSLTNLHKEILDKKVEKFIAGHPKYSIEKYSDFKSVRYALLPKELSESDKKFLYDNFDKIYQSANSEFAKKIDDLDIIPKNENPKSWFQAGMSQTADEAGMAAKEARKINRSSERIISFSEIKSEIANKKNFIGKVQENLKADKALLEKGLVEKVPGTNKYTLSAEFIDTLRKGPIDANEIKKQFQVDLSDKKLRELTVYVQKLNELTPGLWIEKRTFAHLDDASQGGLTADVTGMGSLNIRQIALDIANSPKDATPSTLLKKIREGEEKVTRSFDQIKREFNLTMREVLQQKGIAHDIICSGDDCTVAVKEALTLKDQQDLVKAFASNKNPSQFRLSFVPENVQKNERIQIATHGELFEKSVRKNIKGSLIDSAFLKDITIASVMPATKGSGKVRLIFSSLEMKNLTRKQQDLIKEESKKIIEKLNKELPEDGHSLYRYELAEVDFL